MGENGHTTVARSRQNVISTIEDIPNLNKNTREVAITFNLLRQVVIRKGFLGEVPFRAKL